MYEFCINTCIYVAIDTHLCFIKGHTHIHSIKGRKNSSQVLGKAQVNKLVT